MKLKDLPKDRELVGMVMKIPKRVQLVHSIPKNKMYIKSGWNKGLWLTTTPDAERIYPLTFENFKEIEDFDVSSK